MPRKRSTNYPWDAWFSRDRFTLRYGEHYESSQSAFCQQLRNVASKMGIRLTILDCNTYVEVVVRSREGICAEAQV